MAREARPRPTCCPRDMAGGPRRRPQLPTSPSRRPRLFESGGREKGGRPPQPQLHLQNAAARSRLPLDPGFAAPRLARRPRKAPPAPRGKMAPVEQLRHQPWRRARPSAILAPSSRPPTPHPRSSVRDGSGAANRAGPAPSQHTKSTAAVSLFFPADAGLAGGSRLGLESSARLPGLVRVGPRVLGGAPEPGSGHREGEPRQQVRAAAAEGRGRGRSGRRPRALPAADRKSVV